MNEKDFIPFEDEEDYDPEESPLDVVDNSYKPTNENILKSVSPAKWESLITILDLLSKDSDDPIIIKDSIVTHSFNGAIIRADLNKTFDDEKINLHILSPKKWVRLFRQIKSDSVYIIDNEEKNIYTITNGSIRLHLPKQLEFITKDLQMPKLNKTYTVSEKELSKDIRDIVLNLSKGSEYIEFLIKDDNWKAVNIPNTGVYIFDAFINDDNISKLDETTADLSLRSSIFLPISADEYSVIIGKKEDLSYFSYTICKTGFVSVEIYETLDDVSGNPDFFNL